MNDHSSYSLSRGSKFIVVSLSYALVKPKGTDAIDVSEVLTNIQSIIIQPAG